MYICSSAPRPSNIYGSKHIRHGQGGPKPRLPQIFTPALSARRDPPAYCPRLEHDRSSVHLSRLAIYFFIYPPYRIPNIQYIHSTQLSSRTIASAGAGPGGVIVMYLHNATNAPTPEARRIDAVSNKYSAVSYPKSNKPIKRFYKASCMLCMLCMYIDLCNAKKHSNASQTDR